MIDASPFGGSNFHPLKWNTESLLSRHNPPSPLHIFTSEDPQINAPENDANLGHRPHDGPATPISGGDAVSNITSGQVGPSSAWIGAIDSHSKAPSHSLPPSHLVAAAEAPSPNKSPSASARMLDDFSLPDPQPGGDPRSVGPEICDRPLHASIDGDELLFSSSPDSSFIRSFLEAPSELYSSYDVLLDDTRDTASRVASAKAQSDAPDANTKRPAVKHDLPSDSMFRREGNDDPRNYASSGASTPASSSQQINNGDGYLSLEYSKFKPSGGGGGGAPSRKTKADTGGGGVARHQLSLWEERPNYPHTSSGLRSERGTRAGNRGGGLDRSNPVSPYPSSNTRRPRKSEKRPALEHPVLLDQRQDWFLGKSPATDNGEPFEEIEGLVARLRTVLGEVKQYKQLLSCRDSIAQKLLDAFQCLLDMPQLDAEFRRNLLVAMQRLSRCAGLYPTCYGLRDIELIGEHPVAAGSFADIYKGRFMGQGVCLKVIRIYQTSEVDHFLKQFAQEAILWGQLSHPNLLPIYGLYRYTSRLCLVSPWMDNGDLSVFLKHNPNASRIHLTSDVASGVAYLHAHDIIHGDLKGANILVNAAGRACLADFGISAVSDTSILHWTSHSSAASKGGSIRWQAPELFDVENDEVVHNTKASDVYAWACVCYEIFTGTIPFVELMRDSAVMLKINNGVRPSRPAPSSPAWGSWGLTEVIWSLMQDCWDGSPDKRPTILEVIARYDSFVYQDDRPVESGNISPAHFRDSVGGRSGLPTVRELEDWLSVVR